ncbi:hypothetical protein GN958_ATG21560 [Phytophthora infestans]|uniref:Uncharacterized protein n=1 Tax=Phytophthora infestans TaxID=4787 RepID=A0A8S9TK16_PHYIN|nr:hypothetical protein GN958_ATG21560 [Phytophthora infestans]
MKQLKESRRLRKICPHQAATLINIRQNLCQLERETLPCVVEQKEKLETLAQWLMSGLKSSTGKRCRPMEQETMLDVKRDKNTFHETAVKKHSFEDGVMEK